MAKSVNEIFKAAGRDPPPYQPSNNDSSKVAEMIRKLSALGVAQIDKGLQDLKINPADYERASPPQRFVQVHTALTLQGVERSRGELVGLVPVQTFEKPTGGGDTKLALSRLSPIA